ncbi:MAG: hypothetical protein KC442_12415, partial [Thermomicrobiales bacterium]|nr:hypothetical protein [Thermomicrobiales bacterium]
MNEDEDLVLNAKAIGLAVGGAALAGLLFVLTRRDNEPAPVVEAAAEVKEDFDREARKAAKEARKHRKSVEEAVKHEQERLREAVATASGDVGAVERDLKAAAWDAQE